MLLEAISNDFRFTDVRLRVAGVGICAEKKVDASTFKLFPSQQIVEFGSWRGKSLTRPV